MGSREITYATMFSRLKEHASWQVQIPLSMRPFFEANGTRSFMRYKDPRANLRIRARVAGLLYHEQPLPDRPRGGEVVGFYTLDFSRTGVGLLVPHELYPGECLRLFLPTMWLIMEVVRCEPRGQHCYTAGGRLVRRHEPSLQAFKFPPRGEAGSLDEAGEMMEDAEPSSPPTSASLPTGEAVEAIDSAAAAAIASSSGEIAEAGETPPAERCDVLNPRSLPFQDMEKQLGGLFELLCGAGVDFWIAAIRFHDGVDDATAMAAASQEVQAVLRAADRVFTLDDRTLIIAMPNVHAELVFEEAESICQRLKESTTTGPLPHVSAAIARADEGESFVELVRRAVGTAEAAKVEGRGQVVHADPSTAALVGEA